MKVTIDARHADPRIGRVKVGDDVRIGTAIGATIEPDWLWARLVGVLKHHDGIGPYVLRKYVDGDGWYPTGEYLKTSFIGLVPWNGAGVDRALLEAQARRAEAAGFAMVTDVSDRPVHGHGGAGDVRFGEAS